LVRKHNNAVHQIPVFSPSSFPHAAKTGDAKPQAQAVAGETIKAPMSGIFYRSPSPSSPPYVREGDAVKEGQVIYVIEAMKVFNEIKAEFNCVIEKVMQENGKAIEPNADIFQVKK
ncbi:MAG: biotin/lipoyl-containing protein, partial [Elusimicrobiota bacterium]